MKRYVLACDLEDDPQLIEEYKKYHHKIWPEIKKSIYASGIENMELYNTGNRLFMILEVGESFSFELKEKLDASNPVVREWEELMGKYQRALPTAEPGKKWTLLTKIFALNE